MSRQPNPAAPSYDIEVSGERLDRVRRTEIIQAVRATLQRERCPAASVSVALVNDSTIADLHLRYLGISGPTDVLSFELGDRPEDGVDGEVVVSKQAVRREARRRSIRPREELLRYVIHGTLHLLGYRDDGAGRAKAMHRIEDEVLATLRTAR